MSADEGGGGVRQMLMLADEGGGGSLACLRKQIYVTQFQAVSNFPAFSPFIALINVFPSL